MVGSVWLLFTEYSGAVFCAFHERVSLPLDELVLHRIES